MSLHFWQENDCYPKVGVTHKKDDPEVILYYIYFTLPKSGKKFISAYPLFTDATEALKVCKEITEDRF